MIDELIKEMFDPCHACQGSGIQQLGEDSERECPSCDGRGKVLSSEGGILQHIILHGEHPFD